MTFISLLWLPVLLSAVAVFVLSAASHMLLPWRVAEIAAAPGPEALQAAIRDLAPGQYAFPVEADPKKRGGQEAMARWAAGPSGWLTVVPRGPMRMGTMLGQSFLTYLAVSFLAAYVAELALGHAPAPILVMRVVSVFGVVAYGTGTVFTSIWYARPWKSYAADLLDAVVQGFAMAAVFTLLWPR